MGDYLPIPDYLDMVQWINLAIAIATNIGAIYLVITMVRWTNRLRYSHTSLRPLIFSLAIAKIAVWFWTLSSIAQIVYFDENQPLVTLSARLLFLIAVLIQIRVAIQIDPAPISDSAVVESDIDPRLILIVDDNEALARIYRNKLRKDGANAEYVTNGLDAITIVEQEHPRGMIVDLGLPGMDGVELTVKVRDIGYKGPVVAISGAVSLLNKDKIEAAGFSEVLAKPIRSAELAEAVRKWF